MLQVFQRLNPFIRRRRVRYLAPRKTRGQSLVEIAIAFPLMLILLSGVVEFGFMINFYLSLLDATRDAARYYSNADPFNPDSSDNIAFYANTAALAVARLQGSDPSQPLITIDGTTDDVIVSVFSISIDGGGVASGIRYPTSGPYSQYGSHISAFTTQDVVDILNNSGNSLVDTGILVVEIYWGYHQVLKLPWLTPFLADPSILHAYSMMPNSAAEPVVP